MRITRVNIEAAKERAEELLNELEAFNEAADAWLEIQDEERPDPDERRDARSELESALESLESDGIQL